MQSYGKEATVAPNTATPGFGSYPHEHTNFNVGMMQASPPGISYVGTAISQSLPQASPVNVQPLQGFPSSLPSPLAPEQPPVAPPSWPAPPCPSHSLEYQDLQFWTSDRVSEWLASIGLGHLKELFQEHRISGDILVDLSQTDLSEMGVSALGDRKRILRGIALLQLPQIASNPSSPQGFAFH